MVGACRMEGHAGFFGRRRMEIAQMPDELKRKGEDDYYELFFAGL